MRFYVLHKCYLLGEKTFYLFAASHFKKWRGNAFSSEINPDSSLNLSEHHMENLY